MLDIFVFSFVIALTGALSPGPLLTFTIYKSLTEKRGYLATIYILLGHATVELALILALLAGASIFFRIPIILMLIGIIGGSFLTILGTMLTINTLKTDPNLIVKDDYTQLKIFKGNSYLGGMLVSITNPFWEFWWAIVGLSFLINFNIGFHNVLGLILFFIGHELGDIAWYLPISFFIHLGGKSLNQKVYKYVLIACGLFMIAFGVYLAVNSILSPFS
jgi:threonine/homoserine/homoserine lactone efflux protein